MRWCTKFDKYKVWIWAGQGTVWITTQQIFDYLFHNIDEKLVFFIGLTQFEERTVFKWVMSKAQFEAWPKHSSDGPGAFETKRIKNQELY